jgi:tellurite resistance protein
MRSLCLAVWFLLLLGGLAEARVGGGQHYSSPSHSSPSHSSSHSTSTSHASSGISHPPGNGYASAPFVPYSRTGVSSFQFVNPLLIVALFVLAIVLVVMLRRIFGASAGTQRALEERDAIARLEITSADREAWVAALQRRDPAFAVGPFLQRVKSLFLATQQAWSGGELLSVRRFLSDATWLRFRLQLALLQAQGLRNVTADMTVTDMELLGLEQNEWFDTLHVAVRARARDADVPVAWSEAKAHAAASHAEAQPFTEVWSLVRKPGVRSSADSALAARACPSCGAPFDGGAASTCSYCKAVVNSGAYDWVLAEITQAVEVIRANAPVAGLETLRQRDPGLSLEVLEDRASLVFWRWVEAQSTGEPERLARLAQPGPVERLQADVQRLAERRERRVFLECAVGEVRVRAFEDTTNGRTLAHIEIRWSARTGVGPLGHPPPPLPVLPQRWIFTLVRATDATSRTEQGMSTDRCAQCGGPLGDELAPKCQWCDTLLAGDLRDWTLAEACPVEAWAGRASSGEPVAAAHAPVVQDLEERERLLYTMAAMAMADGEVDARERRILLQCAERWGLPPSQVDEALAAGLGSLETLLPSTDAGEPFLRALAQLAGVDGRVDATERRMLESVATRLGLAQRLPAVLASVGAS